MILVAQFCTMPLLRRSNTCHSSLLADCRTPLNGRLRHRVRYETRVSSCGWMVRGVSLKEFQVPFVLPLTATLRDLSLLLYLLLFLALSAVPFRRVNPAAAAAAAAALRIKSRKGARRRKGESGRRLLHCKNFSHFDSSA